VLMLLPEADWNSVVSVATEGRLFLHATCFSTRRIRSASLCGLPLWGWAVAAPKRFHFTITVLRVDRGSSSRTEMRRTELLERWHPLTCHVEDHWVLLLTVCLWRVHGCVLDFIHLSATCVAHIVKYSILKECAHTFGKCSVCSREDHAACHLFTQHHTTYTRC
jgi:hypothetical protein